MLAVRAARQHRAQHDRHADGAGGLVDRRGGVRVAQRVDVGGVLRPEHQVGRGRRPAATSAASCSVTRDVVVEHRAPLGVEVQAEPGHVALDRGDRHGAPPGRRRRPGTSAAERTGEQRPRRRARRARPAARTSPRAAPRRAGHRQREPGEHGHERQQRGAADRGQPAAAGRRAGRTRPGPTGTRRTASARAAPPRRPTRAAAHSRRAAQPRHVTAMPGTGGRRRTAPRRRRAPATAPGRRRCRSSAAAAGRTPARTARRARSRRGALRPWQAAPSSPNAGQHQPPRRARREPEVEQHPAAGGTGGAGEERDERPSGAPAQPPARQARPGAGARGGRVGGRCGHVPSLRALTGDDGRAGARRGRCRCRCEPGHRARNNRRACCDARETSMGVRRPDTARGGRPQGRGQSATRWALPRRSSTPGAPVRRYHS